MFLVPLLAWAVCTAAAAEAPSEAEAQKESQFLRLRRAEDGSPVALEVAIVRYVPMDCGQTAPTVDLIPAIHVGDRAYYAKLNELFGKYEAVLYELVADEGTKVPKGGPKRSSHPVSLIQQGMTKLLDLEFQLEGVDYTAENMVHADMTPDEFAASMRERGESMFQVFLRMMGHAMAQQQPGSASGPSDWDMVVALFSKDRAIKLKRLMAEQFEDMEGSLSAVEGPDGSTLITERNKVALGVLREQLDGGKKTVSVFYGAGHMPDFDQRLREDFALVPIRTEWVVAWDLTEKPAAERDPESQKRDEPAADSPAPATAE